MYYSTTDVYESKRKIVTFAKSLVPEEIKLNANLLPMAYSEFYLLKVLFSVIWLKPKGTDPGKKILLNV